MKRFVPVLLTACLGLTAQARSQALAPGDKVIGVWGGSTYYSATLKSIEGDQAILAWDDGSSPSGSPLAKVMKLNAAGTKLDLKAGDAGYCKFGGTSFVPCLVVEPTANGVKAMNPTNESVTELAVTAIVVPTGPIAIDLNKQVESAKKALELRKSIQADKPPLGAGTSAPQKGDWVLALWSDGKFWEARILDKDASTVKLLWSDGQISEGYDPKNVAPYPNLDQAYDVKTGDVIYVKWSASPTWYIAKVQNVLGPDVLDILYQDGTSGKTRRGRYLPQEGTATK